VRSETRPAALLAFRPRGALAQALWHRHSIRVQLLIVFIAIDIVAALFAGGVTILKARTATRVEIAASLELAQLLISDAVELMQQEVPAERFLADLSSRLRLVRHVRIAVKDAAAQPLAVPVSPTEAARGDDRPPAPAWFATLIAPPVEGRSVPVVVNRQRIGTVEIVAEPRDEIAEVWESTVALGLVGLIVNVAVIAVLYFLFGRVLGPLGGLAAGLADLERRNYRVRLPPVETRELAAITARFNALAGALEAARAENLSLNERLITAQDDERRRTALELHDEVGPSLFGLKANASSIASVAKELPEAAARKLTERVGDLLSIIEHLQAINRTMLNRLRPMALGHVPLRDIVGELVSDRARQHPEIAFAFSPGTIGRSYGDSIDLTIYRCVQEGLTNAVRHAQPKRVGIRLGEANGSGNDVGGDGGSRIELTIRDDGCGIAPGTRMGFGILGMQERVQGLGGRYMIDGASGGTSISIVIPLHDNASRAAGEPA
jgi:two-component system sensor histidine kinase UhpB